MENEHANRANGTPGTSSPWWTPDKWPSEQARLDYLRERKAAFDQAKEERIWAGLEPCPIPAPQKRRQKKSKKRKWGTGGSAVMGSYSRKSSGQKFGW